jgi:hypothetical protein
MSELRQTLQRVPLPRTVEGCPDASGRVRAVGAHGHAPGQWSGLGDHPHIQNKGVFTKRTYFQIQNRSVGGSFIKR